MVRIGGVEPEQAANQASRWRRGVEHQIFRRVVADDFPAITQLMIDSSDRVWVRGFDENSWPNGLSPTWHVFGSSGQYLGSVSVPLDFIYEISDSGLLGSVIDAAGTERIGAVKLPDASGDWTVQ